MHRLASHVVLPRSPLPRLGRLVVPALVAAGVLAGCGGSSTHVDAGNTVDAPALGAKISAGLVQRYAVATPRVSCPSGVKSTKNTTFNCSTTIDGQHLPINAEVTADNDVDWQPGAAVISTAKTAGAIGTTFSTQLQLSVTATCGARRISIVAVGHSFTCEAKVNGDPRQVTVTAKDLAGNVGFTLAPPGGGTGSTAPPVTAAPTPGSTPGAPATLPGD